MKIFKQENISEDFLNFYRFFFQINLFSAVLSLILGVFFIFAPGLSITFIVYAFAGYLIISSIFHLISVFRYIKELKEKVYLLIKDIISIIAGLLLIIISDITIIMLFYIIGIWFIFTGIVEVISTIRYNRKIEYSISMIIAGIISILFGIALLIWPIAGAIAMAWLIGIVFIFWGGSYLAHAYNFRKYFSERKK